ncbi:MAG: hypothetical protein EHM61_06430 [Acidobacteria bacterium]|nr:MAG: hypothetical protein EHM61_06430 [Acidobacteriota bacterium]
MKRYIRPSVHNVFVLVLFMSTSLGIVPTAEAQTPASYVLEVGKMGTGSGTIASDTAAIDCGARCSAIQSAYTTIRLEARPDPGFAFMGWSGACQGTETCNLRMDSNKKVIALFGVDGSNESWFRQYDGEGIGNIIATEDGGFLAAGWKQYRLWFFKLDQNGSLVWQQLHDYVEPTSSLGLLEVSDGYLLLHHARFQPVHLRKVDKTGQLVWSQSFQLNPSPDAVFIAKRAGDGCVIAGQAYSSWLMAVNASGQTDWIKSYGPRTLQALKATGDGSYVVGGTGNLHSYSDSYQVLSLTSTGEVKWAKSYQVSNSEQHSFENLTTSPDGNLLVTGHVGTKIVALQLNSAGQPMWTKDFGSTGVQYWDSPGEVLSSGLIGGGYLICAARSVHPWGKQGWITRIDIDGNICWQELLGGDYSLITTTSPTPDGGFVVAGKQGWALKADEAGHLSSCASVYDSEIAAASDAQASVADIAISIEPVSATVSPFPVNVETAEATETLICPRSAPRLSVGDVRVVEDDTGAPAHSVAFQVKLSEASSQTVGVYCQTIAQTASEGLDYWGKTGTLTIPAGGTQGLFYVQIHTDTLEEQDETLQLVLSEARNATIEDGTGLGTIIDDDAVGTLTVRKEGTGSGLITGNGISCGSDCTGTLRKGTEVSLSVIPDSDSVFVGWKECQAPCPIVMGSNTTVTAEFRRAYPLTVQRASNGLVKSHDGAINCGLNGPNCVARYDPGATVTLTVTANAGSRFLGWLGACSGTGPCQVTMDGTKAVAPQISPIPFVLQVTKAGSGSGRVFSGNAINCGDDCSQESSPGQAFGLTARADPGSLFTGWSGACAGTGPCSVTLDSDKTVTATFEQQGCTSVLNGPGAEVSAAGGSGAVGLTGSNDCRWQALSLASWISITAGQNGSGSGQIQYAVSPNPGPARSGVLSVSGQRYTVNQAAGCSIALSPASATVTAAGGSGNVSVSGQCEWTASSAVTWVAITRGMNGSGSGTIEYSVLPNQSVEAREGILRIAGQSFTVSQPGASCPVALSWSTRTVAPAGGSYDLDVSLPAGCNWTATKQDQWISLANPSGSGSRKLTFAVAQNPSVDTRIGKIRLNDFEAEVVQPGVNTWFTAGPELGGYWGLTGHPSNPAIILVASSAGGFRSTDGGLSWKRVTPSSGDPYIAKIVVSAPDPNWLWATTSNGFIRTTDGGATWKTVGSTAPSYLTAHPSEREVLYSAGITGVLKCTDGEQFVLLAGSPRSVAGLAIDPVNPNRLLVSSRQGFFRTTDGGLTWRAVQSGPPLNDKDYTAAFVFDGGNHEIVYARTSDAFWRSADGGENWTRLQTGTSMGCSGFFSADNLQPGHVYVGGCGLVRKSTDAGSTWTDAGSLPLTAGAAMFPGGSPESGWLATTSEGVERSADGITWQAVRGLVPSSVSFVALDPVDSRVYAGSYPRVWISEDQATSWLAHPSAPTQNGGLVFDPSNPAVRYLLGSAGVHKTTDGGATWISLNFPTAASSLAIDPGNPLRLYVIGSYGSLYTSPDGGSTWEWAICGGLMVPTVNSILVRPSETGVLYAGTRYQGVMKSRDFGTTWAETGWVPDWPYDTDYVSVSKMAIHPLRPQSLFIATNRGLLESEDDGLNWELRYGGYGGEVTDFSLDPSDPARLWVVRSSEVFLSRGPGSDWVKLKRGLEAPSAVVRSCVVSRTDPGQVYLATSRGVFTRQSGVECGSALAQTTANIPAAGGTRELSFTASSGCTWLIESEVGWITLGSPASGTGNGILTYTVQANNGAERRGSIRVAGQDFTVIQQSSCNFTLKETGKQFPASGGIGQVKPGCVGSLCSWTAETDSPWIYLEMNGRTGCAFGIEFVVFSNSGPPRAGHIRIGGLTYTVEQSSGLPQPTQDWGAWPSTEAWSDVLAGDFNGDGRDDIAGRNMSEAQLWVALSTGSGFENQVWGSWLRGETWVDLSVGDFNDDGRDDIAGRIATTGEWRVAISIGTRFEMKNWGQWDPAVNWVDVRVGDFNHDGFKDVVGRSFSDGKIWVGYSDGTRFLNQQCDSWTPGVEWVDVGVLHRAAGQPDMLFGRSLQANQRAFLDFGKCSSEVHEDWPPAVTWVDVLFGDFDGDGETEISRRGLENGEWWLDVYGPIEAVGRWPTGVTWKALKVGDFNGDSKVDIVGRAADTGEVWVALADVPPGNFGARFANQHWDTWPTTVSWTDEVVGDFDGDGASDLAGRVAETGHWYVRLGTSGGGLLISAVSPTRRFPVSRRAPRRTLR